MSGSEIKIDFNLAAWSRPNEEKPNQMFNLKAILNVNAYVLTENQLLEATLRGAIEMGLVQSTPEVDSALFRLKTSEHSCDAYDLTLAANGAVLTFGLGPALEAAIDAAVAKMPDPSTGDLPHREEEPVPFVPADPSDGPAPEEVKGLLVQVMDRAPSIATVRAWSGEQRKKARAWAKKSLKLLTTTGPNGPTPREALPARPDFIHEPAPRTREPVKATEPVTPSPAPSSASTASSARRRAFFDGDDDEATEEPEA